MVEYIEKEAAQKIICGWCGVCKSPTVCDLMHCDDICPQFAQIPAADVLPRDEAIKMGAELAAMHGSDATSQQLEEAYLKGVEYGMTRRNVRLVLRGKWRFEEGDGETCSDGWVCSACSYGFHTHVPYFEDFNFCPNCGADMREER